MAFPWLPSSTGTLTTNTCARDIYNLYFLSYRRPPALWRKLQAIFLQCCFTSVSASPISWLPISEKNLGVTLLERVSPFLLQLLWRNRLTSGFYLFDLVCISSFSCCYHETPDKSYLGWKRFILAHGLRVPPMTTQKSWPWKFEVEAIVSKGKKQREMLALSLLYPPPFFFGHPRYQPREWHHPQWVGLPTSVHLPRYFPLSTPRGWVVHSPSLDSFSESDFWSIFITNILTCYLHYSKSPH